MTIKFRTHLFIIFRGFIIEKSPTVDIIKPTNIAIDFERAKAFIPKDGAKITTPRKKKTGNTIANK